MANTDRARKLLVRTALVTTSTIATLIGAQNLALMDARALMPAETVTDNNVVGAMPDAVQAPVPVTHSAPEITIMQAAPSITILRQAGQVSMAAPAVSAPTTTSIQPPAPAQISAPAPVIVQQAQPVPQRSRSSR